MNLGTQHQNHITFPPLQRLRFNTRVTKVCVDPPTTGMPSLHPVSVHTSNGTEIRARQVLVTVPLGVLQSGSIEFSPPLPQDKTDALARFQAGLLDIVVLRFDKIFWPKDVHFFGVISDQHAATRLTLSHIVPDNQQDQDPSRWGMSTILNLTSARSDETPLLQMQVRFPNFVWGPGAVFFFEAIFIWLYFLLFYIRTLFARLLCCIF